jgi:transposase
MAARLDSRGHAITGRTIYPLEFKLRVLQALEEKPLQQVLKEFGLPRRQAVQFWCKNRERLLEQAARRQASRQLYYSQLTLLERALKRVTMERDILKKAVSYFARQQRRSANTYSRTGKRHP